MIGSKMIQFLIFITLFFFNYSFASHDTDPSIEFDVQKYGAQPGGDFDCTQAFLDAWKAACDSNWPRVTIYAPQGVYLLRHAKFDGSSCNKDRILFLFKGSTLLAPSDFNTIGDDEHWLVFYQVTRLTVRGGVINGNGKKLWGCKKSHNQCPHGVTSLGIYHSNEVTIKAVTFVDSEMFHTVAYGCVNINYIGIAIIAPEDSPNTDGIHLQMSSGVNIRGAFIGTGDDCISMGEGTTNVWIENVVCGPGHGISIGSLCKSEHEAGVQNVTVKNATLIGTQNGLRIKAWSKTCTAFVRDVLYQDIIIDNANNPIIITTNYCPENNCDSEGESTVDIGNIAFRNIKGTSASPIAVQIDCPVKHECHNITMDGVELHYDGKDQTTASCSNAEVFVTDNVVPTLQHC